MGDLDAHFTVSRLLGHERADVTNIYLASVKKEIVMEYNYVSYEDIPLIMTVEDLMPILLIGRNTAYDLVRSGEIQSIRVGRQIRIPRDALIAFLENTH